jgi:serine/threonine-protein kinase
MVCDHRLIKNAIFNAGKLTPNSMAVSIPEFWNLMLASRMASPNSLPGLQAKFSQLKGAEQEGNVATLAQWLIAQGMLSRYQAKVLMAGQPGPFIYGDYRVFDRVGSGRLQGAFRALHPASRHRVLLWFHSGPMVQNVQWWSVVVEQIALAAQNVHPRIARVYHLCDLGQFKFTALEDLQGDSADARLAAGPIPCAVACRMIRQAALGLSRMHELKQLHGSIRPQNLWIDVEENVKLLLPPVSRDPRIVPGSIDLSVANPGEEVLRQADYLAPEMAQTGQMPDRTTDIYALGCTLFHLLAGKPPYAGRDVLSKLASHGSDRIPSLENFGVPAVVNQLIAGMMAKEPSQRFQKPRQVVEALTVILEKLDSTQLHRPATAVSNKLPEYEAWLQPYKLAPESKTNWVPEIETPPILAASLRAEEQISTQDLFPELGSPPSHMPASPQHAGGVTLSADPQMGIDIAGAFSPHVRSARAIAPGTMPAQPIASPPMRIASATSQALPAANIPQPLSFQPDEADVIIPFGSAGLKTQKRGQRRSLYSGAVVAAFMMILLFLWLSMNKKPAENSSGGATTVNSPPSNGSEADSSKPASENNSNTKKPADTNPSEEKTGSDTKGAAPSANGNGAGTGIQKSANLSIAQSPPNEKGIGEKAAKNVAKNERGGIIPDNISLVANFSTAACSAKSLDAVDPTNAKLEADVQPLTAKVIADDGRSLWNSPTSGAPITLSYLAPGTQAVLALRPADLLHHHDGEKILAALGPAGDATLRNVEKLCGVPLAEIEQLTIGWIDQLGPAAQSAIVPMYVIRFTKPVSPEKLLAQWGYPASLKSSNWMMYQIPQGLAAVFPPKPEGTLLVLGTAATIQEVIKLAGQSPPTPRPIEKLLRTSDDQRLATLVWMPNVDLQIASDLPSDNPGQILLSWARHFLGIEARAAALSANLSDGNLFLELRVEGPLTRSPEIVARECKDRLAQLGGDMENKFKELSLDAYDKPLLTRFAQMVKLLDKYTRTGAEEDQAILRCYLPAVAAENLAIETELALVEGMAAPTAGKTDLAAQNSQSLQTMSQRLKRVTTLSFARDTLEKAIQMLADDLGIKAEIIGSDLQLEGITKNQSFGLDEKDKPADEILRDIMLKANPDGKLVYVIKRNPSDEETLCITTRQAVAKRGDALPPELEKPPAKK